MILDEHLIKFDLFSIFSTEFVKKYDENYLILLFSKNIVFIVFGDVMKSKQSHFYKICMKIQSNFDEKYIFWMKN